MEAKVATARGRIEGLNRPFTGGGAAVFILLWAVPRRFGEWVNTALLPGVVARALKPVRLLEPRADEHSSTP